MQGFKYLVFDNGKEFIEVWNETKYNFNLKNKKEIKEFSNAYNFNDSNKSKNQWEI